MSQRFSIPLMFCTILYFVVAPVRAAAADIPYRGVNLSGAEAGGCSKEVKYGFKYIYPPPTLIDYFIAQGMNTFRLPFCWERLQAAAFAELDAAELARIDQVVDHASAKGAYVLLDPHNYGQYRGNPVSSDSGNAMFADFWRRLAAHYRDNNHVLFGLMNEPHGVSSENWLKSANAAIAAIRASGAKNLLLVPGTAWSGAHSWTGGSYGTPNSVSMLHIDDPANNYAYEVHQYFDRDSSGTSASCVSEDIGAKRVAALHDWLRANHKKAFLGEFGAARSDLCYAAVYNLLDSIHQNPNLWIGWTYWSAGPWLGNYMFALPLPNAPAGPSQLDVLKKFLGSSACGDCSKPNPPALLPPQ